MSDDLTFQLDFDISRALAAQQKVADGFGKIADSVPKVANSFNGLKSHVESLESSISNVGKSLNTLSSSTRLSTLTASAAQVNAELQKIFSIGGNISRNLGTWEIKNLINDTNNVIRNLQGLESVVSKIASQLKPLNGFKFDYSSVEDYRQKLNNLGNELNALRALKIHFNPLDYSHMESQLLGEIEKIKQAFVNLHPSSNLVKDMVKDFDQFYSTASSLRQKFFEKYTTGNGIVSSDEVAKTLGFGPDLTNKIAAEMNNVSTVVKTSYSAMSNSIKDLLNASGGVSHTGVVSAKDIYTSMGFGGLGYKESDFGKEAKSSITNLSSNYEKATKSITDANRAQMSFYDGMMKLGNIPNFNKIVPDDKEIKKATTAYDAFGRVVKRVFEYGMVYRFQNALLSLPGTFLDVNVAMEKMSATFRGAFGEDAAQKISYVKEMADRYGKGIVDLGDAYRKFSVTLNELGQSDKMTNMIFESTTQALTKAGSTTEDTSNAFRALIQMYSKGVVSGEEFTRQLSQYIPAANSLAARALGVTTAEFKKFLNAGQVIPDQFIPEFAKQMKIFGIGWEETANSMEANIQRMKNSLTDFANSKAFQEAFSDVLKIATGAIKDLANVFAGGRLMAKGDISFTTWMFGSPEELDKAIKSYEDKMSNLDTKIQYYEEKLNKAKSTNNALLDSANDGTGGNFIDTAQMENDLNAAKSEKWISQLRSALKDAAIDYEHFKKLLNEGDLTAKAKVDYDKEAITWIENELRTLKAYDGSSILMTLNVNADSVYSAMQAVERLWSKTKQGLAETAKLEYDATLKRQAVLQDALSKAQSTNDETSRRQIPKLQEDIVKATVEAADAQGKYNKAVKEGAKLQSETSYTEPPKLGRGNTQADRINEVREQLAEAMKNLKSENDTYHQTMKAGDPLLSTKDAEYAKAQSKWNNYAQGRIKQIEEEGSRGANAAARHANAVEKLDGTLDNLLNKEFALANQDPLSAAFAQADEKANSLMKTIKDLAIKGGVSVDEAIKKVSEYTKMAKQLAVDKEIEKVLPWSKKDDNLVSVEKMLNEMGDAIEDYAKRHNISIDQVRKDLKNYEEDARKAYNVAKAFGEAENFGDYANARKLQESVDTGDRGSATKDAWKELYDFYQQITKGMLESRVEMYKKVAEQAKAYGYDEATIQSFIQSKWEDAEKSKLEALEKYGTAAEAFSARLADNFGAYKSAATKARENSVAFADSLTSAVDSFSSGVAQSVGDLIRNIGNGTASIEDLWKNMLSRMLDMLASFIEDALKRWLKDLIGGMFSSDTSNAGSNWLSNIFGGKSNSSNSIDTSFLNTYYQSSNITSGDLIENGKAFGKGFMSLFSNNDSSIAGFLDSLSSSTATKTVTEIPSLLGTGLETGSSLASGAVGATSMLGTLGSVVGVVGAIGGLVGLVSSLFGEKKKEVKKVASGYNVQYAGGKTVTSGVDFYSDGSVVGTGVGDPDVTRKISKAFKDTAEQLHDFADALGFTVNVLESFQMPAMNITSDQLDTYIRNGSNAMAFQALEQAGLRGAFDALAEDGEVYIDEFERLGNAFKTGSSKLAAYGYEMKDVAKITEDQVAALKQQTIETAAGTSQAIMTMAESMGATSDQLAQLAANASDGSQALAVTDEQLQNLLEADWVSKVEDKVGGEEGFTAIMDNLIKNVFDSVGAYAENLGYYNKMASKYISQLGDDSITVENFWDKFNAALKNGLDPDQFEIWGKASEWVNSINSVNDALSEWNDGMTKLNQNLDYRMQVAGGLDYQATLTKQMADAEWELADARKAGYDAAYIARLQEVQAAELEATKRKHEEDYQKEVLSAQERIYSATNDKWGAINIQIAKNEQEYKDFEKTYTHAPGADDTLYKNLEAAYALEIVNMVNEINNGIAKAIADVKETVAERNAKSSGDTNYAEALSMIASYAEELQTAYDNKVDNATIEALMQSQQTELDKYWSDLLNNTSDTNKSVQELLDKLSDEFNEFISNQLEALNASKSEADNLAQSLYSYSKQIKEAIVTWQTTDNPTYNSQQTYYAMLAQFNETYRKAMGGDTSALGNITTYAQSLKEAAAKNFGSAAQYNAFYRDLLVKMNALGEQTNNLADEQDAFSRLLDIEIKMYDLLKTELSKDDPNTGLISQIVSVITGVNTTLLNSDGYLNSLNNFTASSNLGGYGAIVDALSDKGSLYKSIDRIQLATGELNNLLSKFVSLSLKEELKYKWQYAESAASLAQTDYISAFRGSPTGLWAQMLAGTSAGDTVSELLSLLPTAQSTYGGVYKPIIQSFIENTPDWRNVLAYYTPHTLANGTIQGGAAQYAINWEQFVPAYIEKIQNMYDNAVKTNNTQDQGYYGYLLSDVALGQTLAKKDAYEQAQADAEAARLAYENYQETTAVGIEETASNTSGISETNSSLDDLKLSVEALKDAIENLAKTNDASNIAIIQWARKTALSLDEIVNNGVTTNSSVS